MARPARTLACSFLRARSIAARFGFAILLIGVACGTSPAGSGDQDTSGASGASSGSGGGLGQAGGEAVQSGDAGTAGQVVGIGGASGSGGSDGTGGTTANGGSGGRGGSAGAGGSGGSAGSGGSVVLGKCDSLAAVGQWENITPAEVVAHPSYTNTLVPIVDPQNSSTVYVTTDSRGIFKSVDCGASWVKINTGANATQLSGGRIWGAVIDPSHTTTLYALTGYGPHGLWKTNNGGVDWAQLFQPGSEIATNTTGFVELVSMDPKDPQHLLIDFHQGGNCGGGHTPVCFGETTNGGQDWKIVDFPANLASAPSEGDGLAILHDKVWIVEEGGHLFRTSDGGQTWAAVTPVTGGNPYIQIPGNGSIFQLPDNSYVLGSQQGVIISKDDGATWSLIANSGSWLTPVLGDGKRLYAAGAPNQVAIWTASYSDIKTWSALNTPGLHPTAASGPIGPWTLAYDSGHHVMYMSNQAGGLWRSVTQ